MDLEAQTDVARSAANQAHRDKERAQHEKAIQEQKAAFLEEELGRTSNALQQERRKHAAEVRLEPCFGLHIFRFSYPGSRWPITAQLTRAVDILSSM